MTSTPIKLVVLPRAAQELTEQADYYGEHANLSLAARWRTAFGRTIRPLRQFPESGSLLNSSVPALRNIRRLPVPGFPNHLVFYEFDTTSKTIFVISVLHGARDIDSVLQMDIRQ